MNTETLSQEQDSLLKRAKSWLRELLRDPKQDIKEAIEEVLEGHQEVTRQMSAEEERMLKNVIRFGDLAVKDIMTPRSEIKAVEYSVSLDELKANIAEHHHTRIPVYNETLDTVKGFVHTKDLVPLLARGAPFNMALILRDILVVPPSMKLVSLLFAMRRGGVHMAIVVDEYGGTDGLVTLEDLFEEIVGEILDEHDEEERETPLKWDARQTCDVDARVLIRKIDENLQLKLSPGEGEAQYDTIGGLIFYQLGRVPARGETVTHKSGARFEILKADPRRIHSVRIYAPAEIVPKTA